MYLILLAISLTVALCFIAFRFAVFALPVMAAISAFQYLADLGWSNSGCVFGAAGAAAVVMLLVIGVLGFASNPFLRLAALALFAVPAVIAGYALMHGLAKTTLDPGFGLTALCSFAGLVVGIAAIANLNAIGELAAGE